VNTLQTVPRPPEKAELLADLAYLIPVRAEVKIAAVGLSPVAEAGQCWLYQQGR